MPFPPDDPAYEYTDPIDWHPAPYYRIFGPSGGGTHHYSPHYISDTGGPVRLHESHTANGGFTEAFGGPHPGLDAALCTWSWVKLGYDLDGGFWNEVCPDTADPSTTFGIHRSSQGSSNYQALPSGGLPSIAGADARLSGWLIRPWLIRLFDNPYADDETLEDEYLTATGTGWPGPGWFLQVERNYPFFVRFQVAPDEVVSTSGQIRTDGVSWLYNGSGWNFQGLNPLAPTAGVWSIGDNPGGDVLAGYSGGLADWVDVPEAWQPEQDLSQQFFTGWVNEPTTDVEVAEQSIPLTLAYGGLIEGNFPNNTTEGRTGQWLMVRAEYRMPLIRWYRERTTVVRQWPREDAQGASSAPRQYPRSKSFRQAGGYPGGSNA